MSRKKRRKRIQAMDPATWDAVCQRCGRCCHERTVTPDGEVLSWGPPCPYLDSESRLCSAYESRFELEIECRPITPTMLRRPRLLPPGCAYRALAREVG